MSLCKKGGNREYRYCEFLGEEHDYVEYKRACPWTNRLCHNPDLDFLGRYIEKPKECTRAYFESMKYFFYKDMMYNIVAYPDGTRIEDKKCSHCAFKSCIDFQDEIPECSRANRKDKRDVYFVLAK